MDDPRSLSEAEIALMDALKLVFEVFIAKGVIKADDLSAALKAQAAKYPLQDQAASIWVVEQLRNSIDDPERKSFRELVARPAEGSG